METSNPSVDKELIAMLDGDLKKHRKDLEFAINEALTDSEEITGAIQKIRDQGFDVFLIIEATIGFNRRDRDQPATQKALPPLKLELTNQDQKFLRSLKISPE